jgi:hypothetical protein
MLELVIFVICLAGASYQAFRIGVREGSARTVDKLHKMKIISYDQVGNIRPNPFFDA